MKLLYLFIALSLSCNQGIEVKSPLKEKTNATISSSTESCVNMAVLRKNNPLNFELVERDQKDIDYGTSLVTYTHQNDILKLNYNNKTSNYDFFFNSKIIGDSSWLKWSSSFTIDIPNLSCYYFLWKGNNFYMLVNNNLQATGLAANYYQIFIYDVAIKEIYDFTTMSDKPAALGVNNSGEDLEFIRVSFADEYFHKESTGKIPFKVETLEFDANKWITKETRTIYCQ